MGAGAAERLAPVPGVGAALVRGERRCVEEGPAAAGRTALVAHPQLMLQHCVLSATAGGAVTAAEVAELRARPEHAEMVHVQGARAVVVGTLEARATRTGVGLLLTPGQRRHHHHHDRQQLHD